MHSKIKPIIVGVLFLLVWNEPIFAGYPLEIIELKGRPAKDVIPLVKPFVGPDGVITGTNYQLIIRTSPDRMRDIRKILERIDHPPRRLLIRVKHGRLTESEKSRMGAGVNSSIGENAKIELGEQVPKDSIRIHAGASRTKSKSDTAHYIHATEGKPAFIASGASVPIQESQSYISGGIIRHQTTTRYRDATGGFYVVPRVNDGQVTLQISQHLDKTDTQSGVFEIQRAATTVTGRLGEWIPIGGIGQDTSKQRSGALRRHSTLNRDDTQIYLLVEEAE